MPFWTVRGLLAACFSAGSGHTWREPQPTKHSRTLKALVVGSLVVWTLLASACQHSDEPDAAIQGSSLVLPETTAADTSQKCPATHTGGCARLIDRESFTAGERTGFVIEYTVGSTGIAVGGGISVGIHHAAEWNTQITSADRPGFVVVRSADPQNLALERIDYAPDGMFLTNQPGLRSDAIFHKVLVAKVRDRKLEPGETLQFHFGAGSEGIVVPPYIDPHHEFRITTDSSGAGVFVAIQQSPVSAIVHDAEQALAAFAPSQAMAGEVIEVNIRVEDLFHNLVESWFGEVDVVDENGKSVAGRVPITSGTGSTQLTLSTGHHRLRLNSTSGQIVGRSNPIKVTIDAPVQRLYWADLHGHTSISDGLGMSADEYFRFGRDSSHLDVVALTDHGHFDWPSTVQAVQQHYAPGDYVTILAQEAGAGPDHMNVYYRRDDQEHLSRWTNDYRDFLAHLKTQYNQRDIEAITAPHHFAYDRGFAGDPDYPFGAWDHRVARFVEVYSSHGTSEFPGNPRPLGRASSDERKYMQHALDQGLRFGVIAASDNHDSHPGRSVWGRYAGGLAGIWAPELTRESIWTSLHDYKTYGTSLDRIYVEFSINENHMGSELTANAPVSVKAYVIGKSDALQVELLRNNETIKAQGTTNGLVEMSLTDSPGPGSNHYYLRVTQDNGERAWSTPIWVTRAF